MPALEPLHGLHVVAAPSALDAARWSDESAGSVTVLRFAPDEAFVIGAAVHDVKLADADAIVVEEHGFVGCCCSMTDIRHHIEWSMTEDEPALRQGAIAGVPAKILAPGDGGSILLVTPAPYASELAERLGWSRLR